MSTLILGALDEELTEFRKHVVDRRDERWNELPITVGSLNKEKVVIATCGAGKTMSALVAQYLVDRYSPERLLFTGIAGSINETLDIGDVVVARDAIQYDLDARAAGFEIGRVPFTSYREIPSDSQLLSAALSFSAEGFRLVEGRVLTGDRFLSREDRGAIDLLIDELAGDAVEMEGASVGLVALVNRLPFLLLRTISDRADGSAKADFKKFLPIASERAFHVVTHVFDVVNGVRG